MKSLQRLRTRIQRALHDADLPVYYAPQYRLPIPSLEHRQGIEPRRADLAAWALLEMGAITPEQLVSPPRVRYADLCRVHTPELLESLTTARTLAHVFAVAESDVPVDEVARTIRLAVGGTLAGARAALAREGPVVNLLGGFHHAFPDKAGGLCPVNDIAVAVAALRAEDFAGKVVVLDLDAHPSDGIAACFEGDPDAWLGSISGSDWGPLTGHPVDSVVIEGADDATYLAALDALLSRMPRPRLAFVIAGGDVIEGDRMGLLRMTVGGARERDLRVARALDGVPTVWVPGGGYSAESWRVLAGTVLAVALRSDVPIPAHADPLSARFADVARRLDPARLKGGPEEPWITEADLADALGMPGAHEHRLLGYYTAAGAEYALYRFGIIEQVRRLGYTDLRVSVDRVSVGDRMQVHGTADGQEHLIFEGVYARTRVHPPPGVRLESDPEVLFVHWLTLRDPRQSFSIDRPQLPGQETPGLGLAREAGHMLGLMADRLGLAGVALQPAWYHVAYATRHHFHFVDPARQGRFEALVRDLEGLALLECTRAIAEGRVLVDGVPYAWEPDLVVAWRDQRPWPEDRAAVEAARDAVRFTVLPEAKEA